jgi:hypothetical protein
MGFFTSWLRSKDYILCTEEEKTCIHNQIRVIIESAEQNELYMSIPNKYVLSLKLKDDMPVRITLEEFVGVCVREKFIRRPFIVHNYVVGGSYVFSFVQGSAAAEEEAQPISNEFDMDILPLPGT